MARGTLNKVILIGRVGADPEMRYMPSGSAVTNISLATNDGYKDKETGEYKDQTEWHRVACFSKLAEIVGEYVRKGSLVYVEGRIRTNKWTDNNGNDRYSTEIIANELQFLDSRGNAEGAPGMQQQQASMRPAPKRQAGPPAQPAQPVAAPEDFEKFDDDIPF